MSTASADALRQRLRVALSARMKQRDKAAVSVLRATLAAIDNAEAVDRPADADQGLAIEQIEAGAGVNDVARRTLTVAQVEQIVRDELAERRSAADEYERAGRADHAAELREGAKILSALLEDA
ncbi:MAG TPA: hypothetical protein VGM10_16045 [Actinocrinis sp.]